MAGIKQYKPTSYGRRHANVSDFTDLTRSTPEKSLLEPLKKSGGRNNHGRTTARFRGGGHKRKYRVIDFKRDKDGVPAKVAHIERDPNRSARIALLHYADGEKRYIICPKDLKQGMTVVSGPKCEPQVGNCMELGNVPLGLFVHGIELKPGRGAQIARSAGSYAQVQAREGEYAVLLFPSGELRRMNVKCRATLGEVSFAEHMNIKLGKAGRARWLGRRPHTRGSAMNPIDHPMGGGEGRSKGGHHPYSPWGLLAKGGKTRKPKAISSRFIIRPRKRGPHVGQ
jgi:large subunit ribosomal protein L2